MTLSFLASRSLDRDPIPPVPAGHHVVTGADYNYASTISDSLAEGSDLSYIPELLEQLRQVKADRRRALRQLAAGGSRSAGPTGVAQEPLASVVETAGLEPAAFADPLSVAITPILDSDSASRHHPADPIVSAFKTELGRVWDELSQRSRLSLVQADRLRRDIDTYYGSFADPDFAVAVMAYSRALEIELFRRLFEPVQASGTMRYAPTGNPAVDRSLETIVSFQSGGSPLGMGQMAACLANLVCGSPASSGFAAFLSSRLFDMDEFCRTRYPKWLTKFAVGYRNRAAHVSSLSRKDCDKAREYLLAQPRRLLPSLIDIAPLET